METLILVLVAITIEVRGEREAGIRKISPDQYKAVPVLPIRQLSDQAWQLTSHFHAPAHCIGVSRLRFERHPSVHKVLINMWGEQNYSKQCNGRPSFYKIKLPVICLVKIHSPQTCFC